MIVIFEPSKVCHLKIFLLIRFICGYHISVVSATLQILSKAYRIMLLLLIISITMINHEKIGLAICTYIIEYVAYFFISWRTQDEYIFRLYQRISIIDTLPCAPDMYKKLPKFFVGIILFNIWTRFCNIVIICKQEDDCFSFYFIHYAIVCILRDFGPLSIIMIFSIIYLRVNVVRKTIETKGIKHINFQKYSVKNYIEMYVTLVDSLNNISLPLNFSVLTLNLYIFFLRLKAHHYECIFLCFRF